MGFLDEIPAAESLDFDFGLGLPLALPPRGLTGFGLPLLAAFLDDLDFLLPPGTVMVK